MNIDPGTLLHHLMPLLPALIVITIAVWVRLDMTYIQRSIQRKAQLEIDGKQDELETHFQRTLRPRRLFVFLYQKFALPGAIEANYALYLHTRGQSEAALDTVNRAINKILNQPGIMKPFFGSARDRILSSAMHARILILNGLGRYDEARAATAATRGSAYEIEKIGGASILTEAYTGCFDEGLRLAYDRIAIDPTESNIRSCASLCHYYKGEFTEAINVLSRQTKAPAAVGSAEALPIISDDPELEKTLTLVRQRGQAIRQPVALLALTRVYLAQKNYKEATQTLDHAKTVLGANPTIQINYHLYRAHCAAGQGDPVETEKHLAEARDIVAHHPKRGSHYDIHIEASRCYQLLGLTNQARVEVAAGESFALHPIEKHMIPWLYAQIAEADGHPTEAIRSYETLIADGIPSRFHQQALTALAQLKGN